MKKPYLVTHEEKDPIFVMAISPKVAAMEVADKIADDNRRYGKFKVTLLQSGYTLNYVNLREKNYNISFNREVRLITEAA